MRDENDSQPFSFELPHHAEQPFHLARIKTGSRLIENQQFGRDIERARDGHELLNGDGIAGERFGNIDIDAEPRHGFARPLVNIAPANKTETRALPSEANILSHRDERHEIHFLINRADAERLRFLWIARAD